MQKQNWKFSKDVCANTYANTLWRPERENSTEDCKKKATNHEHISGALIFTQVGQLQQKSKPLTVVANGGCLFYSMFPMHIFLSTEHVVKLEASKNKVTNMSWEFTQVQLVSQASPSYHVLHFYHTQRSDTTFQHLGGIFMPCSFHFLAKCANIVVIGRPGPQSQVAKMLDLIPSYVMTWTLTLSTRYLSLFPALSMCREATSSDLLSSLLSGQSLKELPTSIPSSEGQCADLPLCPWNMFWKHMVPQTNQYYSRQGSYCLHRLFGVCLFAV